MTREIILPIKCSTVKKTNAALNIVVRAEIDIICVLDLAYTFLTWSDVARWWYFFITPGYWVPYPSIIQSGYGFLTITVIAVVGLYVICYIWDLIDWVKENKPTFTCIKDEEE